MPISAAQPSRLGLFAFRGKSMNVLVFLLYLLAVIFAFLAAFNAPGTRVSWLGLAVAFALAPALIDATAAL